MCVYSFASLFPSLSLCLKFKQFYFCVHRNPWELRCLVCASTYKMSQCRYVNIPLLNSAAIVIAYVFLVDEAVFNIHFDSSRSYFSFCCLRFVYFLQMASCLWVVIGRYIYCSSIIQNLWNHYRQCEMTMCFEIHNNIIRSRKLYFNDSHHSRSIILK